MYNFITNFTFDYFNECSLLDNLYLDHNLLTKIPNLKPMGNSIRYLTMSYNRLAGVISQDTFLNMSALYNVKLTRNQITNFDEKAMRHLPKLRYLNLDYNRMTTLGDFSRWCVPPLCSQSSFTLYIYSNPITCDFRLCWMKTISNYFYISGSTCSVSSMVCPGMSCIFILDYVCKM